MADRIIRIIKNYDDRTSTLVKLPDFSITLNNNEVA